MSNSDISQKLQHARFIIGLTQEEAGQLVGVTRRAWAHWEEGTRAMPVAAFELFIAKISGQVRSTIKNDPARELIVVIEEETFSPIDVVSNENFLSLTYDQPSEKYVISSLAIDRLSGKKYTHRVKFSPKVNSHVLQAAKKWKMDCIE